MSKFTLNYRKTKKIVLADLEEPNSIEEPFSINGLQCYNPIYNTFFELSDANYDSIALNHRYHIQDLTHVVDITTNNVVEKDIFIKFAPLLDPIRYLIGRYKSQEGIRDLPTLNFAKNDKLANPNNASYIDNFFCYLSSQLLNHHDFLHGIDYYGSFLGIQKKFKMNLADDMDYLVKSDYFNQRKGILYEIDYPITEDPFANFGSRNNKNKLAIHNGSNVTDISLEYIETDGVCDISNTLALESSDDSITLECTNSFTIETGHCFTIDECVYEKSSDTDCDDSSNNSELNYSSSDEDDETDCEANSDSESENDDENDSENDDEDTDEVTEDSEEEPIIKGYIYDFPIQMICLEKCSGTLDQLFAKRILDIDTAASALFQVIMILYAYQKSYYFTHNDLHTNNIMYIETDREFLTYKVHGKYYKVPTYGRIFKLIDFGRAIYRFQGKTFCSDSFAPGGDAATQYNFEPFLNEKKPRLDPNYSFDLCRLGCSIYDFILDIEEETHPEFMPDPLQALIIKWVQDDNEKNVLYMKNGEERYPSFKLYKMIARTVHNKTPESQLSDPLFESFCIGNRSQEETMDLDALPIYS
jgi:hypothetical protein